MSEIQPQKSMMGDDWPLLRMAAALAHANQSLLELTRATADMSRFLQIEMEKKLTKRKEL